MLLQDGQLLLRKRLQHRIAAALCLLLKVHNILLMILQHVLHVGRVESTTAESLQPLHCVPVFRICLGRQLKALRLRQLISS